MYDIFSCAGICNLYNTLTSMKCHSLHSEVHVFFYIIIGKINYNCH